jgi:hypothetical protein
MNIFIKTKKYLKNTLNLVKGCPSFGEYYILPSNSIGVCPFANENSRNLNSNRISLISVDRLEIGIPCVEITKVDYLKLIKNQIESVR